MKKILNSINTKILLNQILIGVLALALVLNFAYKSFLEQSFLIVLSYIAVAPVIYSAFRALIKKRVTIDLLASIALIFTFIQGEWVSAVFINLMLASARLFSAYTERRTENIISSLLKLRPSTVTMQVGETVKDIPLEEVKVGDLIIVESGNRIPIDGVVFRGEASIDQSTLTGESQPVPKKVGDKVFSSTLNTYGSIIVKVEKVGPDTTLEKMIALVDEASRAKTKTETIADKFSAYYIIIMLVSAVVIYLFTKNLNMVLGVLLVTCADDIAVAVPLGFTVAIAKAAKHGIIVKGSAVMEKVRNIDIFVTDKTGTLTKGASKIVELKTYDEITNEEFNKILSICVADSKHPTSLAIAKYLEEKGVELTAPDEVEEHPGDGILVKENGVTYAEGKLEFIKRLGADISAETELDIRNAEKAGLSVSVVSKENKIIGYLSYEDDIKKYVKESILETKEMGVKSWLMLTGDNEYVAHRVAEKVGIDEFKANLTPAGKLEELKKLKAEGYKIAMMGDGVNDAASLALADVSFAMGAIGSDASIEAADITLMHDDVRRVPEAMLLSKESIRIVKQNFGIWMASNIIGLFLVFSGRIGPMGASLFNFITDFLPILNVFQIYYLKINKHTYDEFGGVDLH
ncbi:MAG: cation-translocating P-type ATPase, partial [bacterium]